jgi:hypothetical protein
MLLIFIVSTLALSESALAHAKQPLGISISDVSVTGAVATTGRDVEAPEQKKQNGTCGDICASCCPASSCMAGILATDGVGVMISDFSCKVLPLSRLSDYAASPEDLFHPPRL